MKQRSDNQAICLRSRMEYPTNLTHRDVLTADRVYSRVRAVKRCCTSWVNANRLLFGLNIILNFLLRVLAENCRTFASVQNTDAINEVDGTLAEGVCDLKSGVVIYRPFNTSLLRWSPRECMKISSCPTTQRLTAKCMLGSGFSRIYPLRIAC